jgi:hypothetical protein
VEGLGLISVNGASHCLGLGNFLPCLSSRPLYFIDL